jgi:hypothetical protein
MKRHAKPMVALIFGAILLPGLLCQTAQAQTAQWLLNESGTSILADAFGTATGPEALTVNWSVIENSWDIYTYSYTVNNPAGDVILNNQGQPTLTPEIVDAFSVGFNTTLPGAYLPFSQYGGYSDQNDGVNGLFWSFAAVKAGSASPVLSFQSFLPPAWGDAGAQDANPPSPWSSIPYGQQVPVPDPPTEVAEPTTAALLVLTALLLLPFRSTVRKSISEKAQPGF